jgi:hypothetical protein
MMLPHWIENSDWTVGALIEALQQFPEAAPITLSVPAGSDELLAVSTSGYSDAVILNGRI